MVPGMGWLPEAPPPAPPPAMRPSPTALWLGLASALALQAVGWASARAPIYVSSWAVRVTKGYQEAERLARKFGFVNLGQVGGTWMDGTRGGDLEGPDRWEGSLGYEEGVSVFSLGPRRGNDSVLGDSVQGARSQPMPLSVPFPDLP